MKITVCVGSSCCLKGARTIVSRLRELLDEKGIKDQIEMAGQFCTGNCAEGVNVTLDGAHHSVLPGTVDEFFSQQVLPRLQ